MVFEDPGRDVGTCVAGMFKGVGGGAGMAGPWGAIDGGCMGIPYIGGAMGAAGGPAPATGGKAT